MNSISRPSAMKAYPKAALILLASLVPLVPSLTPAQDVSPGWQHATAPGLAAQAAQSVLGTEPEPDPSPASPAPPAPAPEAPELPVGVGAADEITPEIAALAHGLRNDPRLIFQYCHDRIRHECYWGSKKGALMTLLEGSGNCFDISSLMVALLRAAEVQDVSYAYGRRYIQRDSSLWDPLAIRSWLGVLDPESDDGIPFPHLDAAGFRAHFGIPTTTPVTDDLRYDLLVSQFLTMRGYPWLRLDSEGGYFTIPHVWVRFRDSAGVIRNMDPSCLRFTWKDATVPNRVTSVMTGVPS
jgi:hypothetical protein